MFGIGILILVGLGAGLWWHQRRTGARSDGKKAPLGTSLPVARVPVPRERSLTPAAGTATDWLGQVVQYFRAMGFFGQYVEWPDMVLATHVEQLFRQTWKRNFNPEDPLADFHLLKADVKRVWWEETAGHSLTRRNRCCTTSEAGSSPGSRAVDYSLVVMNSGLAAGYGSA